MTPSDPVVRETADCHIATRIPIATPNESAAEALARIRTGALDSYESVYAVDSEGTLVGVVSLARLLCAAPEATVSSLMEQPLVCVAPHTDQEQVALAALHARVPAVPVVAAGGKLIGVVPASALLEILHREHVEDLHRLAGIARENELVRESIESPPVRRARDRLPWLLIGLAGSMLAALVMSRFERTLEKNLAVSFFVPAIVYLADAIGTQTEAVVVRGLSLSRQPLSRLLFFELGTGMLMGTVLGALAIAIIGLSSGDLRLALSVGIAVLAAGSGATTIGLLLPWALQRAGTDPAFGSGPLATIVQDVLSLLIYFGIAAALVR